MHSCASVRRALLAARRPTSRATPVRCVARACVGVGDSSLSIHQDGPATHPQLPPQPTRAPAETPLPFDIRQVRFATFMTLDAPPNVRSLDRRASLSCVVAKLGVPPST